MCAITVIALSAIVAPCRAPRRVALVARALAYTRGAMRSRHSLLVPPSLLARCAAALVFPAAAQAHGIVGRADLPIPVWLFSWAAAIVLVVSFVALSALWTRPQLQSERRTRLFRFPRTVSWLANLIGAGPVRPRGLQRLRRHGRVWSANFS